MADAPGNRASHYDRYAQFRDLVMSSALDGKKIAAYAVVMIDEHGEIYAGASNAKQCLPELQKMIDYYQPVKPPKPSR